MADILLNVLLGSNISSQSKIKYNNSLLNLGHKILIIIVVI